MGRQLYEYTIDVPLPCVKGTDDMRSLIVNIRGSPRLDLEVAYMTGHEVNRVVPVGY